MLVLIAFIFFCITQTASASIVINEIQISGVDTSDEFIELYNSSDTSVDLTDWYINKKSSTGTERTIVSKSHFKNKTIEGKSYLLLGREEGYQGSIVPDIWWPNSYSLANNNSIILYRGNDTDKDQISWDEITEGNSFQKQINSNWIDATPTPKSSNNSSVSNSDTNNPTINNTTTSFNTNTQIASSSAPLKSTESNIIVKASLKTSVVFAGLATKFKGEVVGSDGRPLFYGRYFWNFGDGYSKEMKVNTGGDISHTYFYPGEYKLILEYYTNDYGDIPESSDSTIIKVIRADILISQVGDEKDFFIELSNNTDKEVDIGKWMLTSGDKRFIFSKNTTISTKNKIIFSPFITGFTFSDKNNLKLVSPEWKTVFDYGASIVTAPILKPIVKNKISHTVSNNASPVDVTLETLNQNYELEDTSDLNLNLEAQAIASESGFEDNKHSYFLIVVLFVLLVAGGGAVYFIRNYKSKELLKIGEDFDILE